MSRLLAILAVAVLIVGAPVALAAPAGSAARTLVPAGTAVVHDGPQLGRLGGLRSRGGGGYLSRRSTGSRRGYGTQRPRRNRGFLRGLFHGLLWGWLLSHLFGGGFPLILPLMLLVFLLVAGRRRRPRASYRW
jgi:hypothetical protein